MLEVIDNLLAGRSIEVGPMVVVGYTAFCLLLGYGLFAIAAFIDDRYSHPRKP